MSDVTIQEITGACIGRPTTTFIGQLYNAKTDKTVNHQLFDDKTLELVKEDLIGTVDFKYKEVSSFSERSSVLDIHAEIQVSVLAGLVNLSGSGDYVKKSDSEISSHELAISCICRTKSKRLTTHNPPIAATKDLLDKTGATHVITSIKYGGAILASFKSKTSSSTSDETIKGEFGIEALEGAVKGFSAKGSAKVEAVNTAKDSLKDFEAAIFVDALKSGIKLPRPGEITETIDFVVAAAENLGEGIPCEFTATPINHYATSLIVSTLAHTMDGAELKRIIETYDQLIALSGKWERITSTLEAIPSIFPTFLDSCRSQRRTVTTFLDTNRQKLAVYLTAYRDKGEPSPLLTEIGKDYDTLLLKCDEFEAEFRKLKGLQTMAKQNLAPLIDIDALQTHVNESKTVVLILIPEQLNPQETKTLYKPNVGRLQAWRDDEARISELGEGKGPTTSGDKGSETGGSKESKTIFVSLFADAKHHERVKALDVGSGDLTKALLESTDEKSTEKGKPRLLSYCPVIDANGVVTGYDWILLGNNGWGLCDSATEGWNYVGSLKDKIPHGRGSKTFIDGSVYRGDWWEGQRHGQGELTTAKGKSKEKGIYKDDEFLGVDGILFEVICYTQRNVAYWTRTIPSSRHSPLEDDVVTLAKSAGLKSHGYSLTIVDGDKSVDFMFYLTSDVGRPSLIPCGTTTERDWSKSDLAQKSVLEIRLLDKDISTGTIETRRPVSHYSLLPTPNSRYDHFRFAVGISALDFGNDGDINIAATVRTNTKEDGLFVATTYPDSVSSSFHKATVSWLRLPAINLDFQRGLHSYLHEWKLGPDAYQTQIKFPQGFSVPPKVLVFLTDLHLGTARRDRQPPIIAYVWHVITSASNITRDGFLLNIEYGKHSYTGGVAVGWIAYPETLTEVFGSTYGISNYATPEHPKPPLENSEAVQFPKTFSKPPHVFAAINSLHIRATANLCLDARVDHVTTTTMICHLNAFIGEDAPRDAVLYEAEMSYLCFE